MDLQSSGVCSRFRLRRQDNPDRAPNIRKAPFGAFADPGQIVRVLSVSHFFLVGNGTALGFAFMVER